MSKPSCHSVSMKINKYIWFGRRTVETVAFFGSARLVKKAGGRHELIGDTADHHAAAREWCSLFAPEIVFKSGGRTGTDSARSAFYSRRAAHSRASFFR